MKKLLLFVTMAASLLFTQCKKEESVSSAGKTVRMTVTAGPGSKTDITENGAITWSEGDKLYVGDGTQYIGYLTIASGVGTPTGTFTGNVTLPTDTKDGEKSFGFFYLGSGELMLEDDATSVDVDFSSQDITKGTDGKLTNASKQHVGYGSATGTVINDVVTDINVMLVSKVAIARFDFKKGTDAYTGALTLSGDNVCNKMTVNFDGTFTGKDGSTTNGISLTGSHSERYVMLVPTGDATAQSLTFTGDNVSGTGEVPGLQANQFYGLTGAIAVTLEEAAPAHETVNMGLPEPYDKLEWATCNVGADSPEGYGDHYAWGEIATKSDYSWTAYKLCNGSYKTLTKYNNNSSYGTVDNETVLDLEDDAARANWGGSWRIPTTEEWKALYDNTTSIWTDNYNSTGVKGRLFTSKTDTSKTLFLPAAGRRQDANAPDEGTTGFYWASSIQLSYPWNADGMYFTATYITPQGGSNRSNGCSVRPVR